MLERATLMTLLAGSIGALGLALFVEHGRGYAPCALCTLARYPHAALIVLALVALYYRRERLGLAGAALALAVAFAISLRHVGIEHAWLPLSDGCQVQSDGLDLDSLRDRLFVQTQPTCDQPGPAWFGFSMAQWHLLAALAASALATGVLSVGGRRS